MNFAEGLDGTWISLTSPASIPPTRTFAPLSSPAIRANSADTSKVGANNMRRLPIRKIPTAKSSTPKTTNAPTIDRRFAGISARVLRRQERRDQRIAAPLEVGDGAASDDPAAIQHQEVIAQAARTGHAVGDDYERRAAAGLE